MGPLPAERSRRPTPTSRRRSPTSTTCWSCCWRTWRRITSSTARSRSGCASRGRTSRSRRSRTSSRRTSSRLGAATERDVQQAKQVLEQTRAPIPQFEAGMRQPTNALCVLLGIRRATCRRGWGPAARSRRPAGGGAGHPRRPAPPPARRPPRRAAGRPRRAPLIGVAKSDLYPRFSLNGSIGVQAEDFGDLFNTPGSIDRVDRARASGGTS